ncbi:hypothetical protein Bca4012_072002 [Brassica carinata]|uniref:Uncharacterized protein n=3 Tax=Brassica TaxID=3705 RepID=A0A0D3CEI7_BRAOL|nr:PREDICTED: uncharacterized protein LOC106344700 [Brassica oleracea var. oleracea]KAG2269883.1 hypothetical protein Bca52824_064438 [Brassica carinata]VDD44002.1 unnamed protein product [Brassica oleracea]
METTKKRKHSDEEKPPEKRQKKTVEAPLESKFTEPVQAFTTLHVTKRKSKVITTKPGDKTETQDHSLKDLIAKAREKVQEKRQIDHRNIDIASQWLAARFAIHQMVKTVYFDDHLKYHTELENLGSDFIRNQVSCLYKFSLLSRSDYYIDESNSE